MWKIYTDGGARGNPGAAACAFVVYDHERVVFEQGIYLGHKTNNEAEYLGVLESLKYLAALPASPSPITWFLDSKLVVEQILGHWRVKEPRLQDLQQQCLRLLAQVFPKSNYHFQHVPRAQNARADALVNQVLDQQKSC